MNEADAGGSARWSSLCAALVVTIFFFGIQRIYELFDFCTYMLNFLASLLIKVLFSSLMWIPWQQGSEVSAHM
ncbi:hypothetical protein E2P81_ATG06761 [Venturia nashicola]|nr:hypothetical protein E2P81_ATG06761 [Venturia nashicola]